MLSNDDRIEIHDLYSRYNLCFDLGYKQGWLNCFAANGCFVASEPVEGQERLGALFDSFGVGGPTQVFKNLQHWNNNLVLESDGETARGMCYVVRFGRRKDSGLLEIVSQGIYEDTIVSENDRWVFGRRKMHREMLEIAAVADLQSLAAGASVQC